MDFQWEESDSVSDCDFGKICTQQLKLSDGKVPKKSFDRPARTSHSLARPRRSTIGINPDFEINGLDLKTVTTSKLVNFSMKIPVFEGLHLAGAFLRA
jgi:hypothetical protein